MKILIADDHPIFRNGLKHILAEESGMIVEDEAENGRQVMSLLARKKYDVVILDIEMPQGSGLDVLKQIKELYPALPVLILSFYPEEQYALRALKLGSAGYLTKESAASELVNAINRVISGGKYITPNIAERLTGLLDGELETRPHERLSEREYQVFHKIAEGKSTSEISNELHLSPKTVSTYKARILEKLGMKNDAQIVRYAVEERLIK